MNGDSLLLWPILIPLIVGIIALVSQNRKGNRVMAYCAALASLGTLLLSVIIWQRGGLQFSWTIPPYDIGLRLASDRMSLLFIGAAGFFGFLISLYSAEISPGKEGGRGYFAYTLWGLAASVGVFLAAGFVTFLMFWTFILIMFYLLISLGRTAASKEAAHRTLTIVGFADFLLLLGFAFLYDARGIWSMPVVRIATVGGMEKAAFLLIVAGALAKTGAMPFHSWLPAVAGGTPVAAVAFFPAILDKLLGIYLLVRAVTFWFEIVPALKVMLMLLGAVTIVGGVSAALVQHDLKRLLAYHAVSQVGYMVLGIGTGVPLGIAGGILHMLNNCIYKGCLFMGAGAIESQAGTSDLDELGGLAERMPKTFMGFLIASLAISGIPPLNGFVSKWMIYQSILEVGLNGARWYLVFLIAAMFGSILTLASFLKAVYSGFLAEPSERAEAAREVSLTTYGPILILAANCIAIGVFPVPVLRYMTWGLLPGAGERLEFLGMWSPVPVTAMLLFCFLMAIGIFFYGKKVRNDRAYVGGEMYQQRTGRIKAGDFYRAASGIQPLVFLSALGRSNYADSYRWLGGGFGGAGRGALYPLDRCVDWFWHALGMTGELLSQGLRRFHVGILTVYVSWVLIGFAVIVLFYMG